MTILKKLFSKITKTNHTWKKRLRIYIIIEKCSEIFIFIFLCCKKIFFDFLFRHRIDLVESCSKTYLFTPFCKTHPLKNGKSQKITNKKTNPKISTQIPPRYRFGILFGGPYIYFSIKPRIRFVVVRTLK